jgi:hypothetical protein
MSIQKQDKAGTGDQEDNDSTKPIKPIRPY